MMPSSRILLRSEQSGGEVAVMENSTPGRWVGPPLHRHAFDEAFYVLDGELTSSASTPASSC